jgi:hypothetical protein
MSKTMLMSCLYAGMAADERGMVCERGGSWTLPDWDLCSMFGWLVADGWCWFVLREEYC